jgi:hypothetical protein
MITLGNKKQNDLSLIYVKKTQKKLIKPLKVFFKRNIC